MFLCRDKYRLELRWDSITYKDGAFGTLQGAKFCGPALKISEKIGAPDSIDLDLTPQHFIVLDCYYIVKLEWDGVEYNGDESVSLINARLSNNLLKELHKLKDSDFIKINTEKHERNLHPFNLVYEAEVVREDSKPYEYTK